MIKTVAPRSARARGWIRAGAGRLRAGEPLAEWGHFTPRFPAGITNRELERAPRDIQAETALVWFHSNLRPWDPTKGGPWFGFVGDNGRAAPNTAGFDQGYWPPQLYDALSVLTAEFGGGTLPDDLLADLATRLPGVAWEWPEAPSPILSEPVPQAELIASALAALDELRGALVALPTVPGVLGHNGVAGEITTDEAENVVAQVDDLQDLLTGPSPDLAEVRTRWDRIWKWVVGLAVVGVAEVAKGALVEAGKDGFDQLHAICSTWSTGHYVGQLLQLLF